MAKIKMSALVSEISGKLNGSVLQRNNGCLSVRKNAYSNPQYNKESVLARQNLQHGFARFNNFSASNQLLWENRAAIAQGASDNATAGMLPGALYYASQLAKFERAGITLIDNGMLSKPITTLSYTRQPSMVSQRYINVQFTATTNAPQFYLVGHAALAKGMTSGNAWGSWHYLGTDTFNFGNVNFDTGYIFGYQWSLFKQPLRVKIALYDRYSGFISAPVIAAVAGS